MKYVFLNLLAIILIIQGIIFWQVPNIHDQALNSNYPENQDSVYYGTSIDLPDCNQYLNSVLSEAEEYKFDYTNYGISEDDGEELESKLKNRNIYYSLGKLKYYQLSQDYDSEFNLLRSFVEQENFFNENISTYIEYLDESYIKNIYNEVKYDNIWEARELVGLAYNRLNVFDAPPLSNIEFGNRVVIDQVLLLNMFFNDPRLLLTERETLKMFVALVDPVNKMDFEMLNKNLKNKEKEMLKDIIRYFEGVKIFYKKDYRKAHDVFEEVSKESKNHPLRDLALLMQIRCLFWSQKWESSPWLTRSQTIAAIQFIGGKIYIPTLRSDVSFYVDSLGVTPFITSKYQSKSEE